MQPAVAAPPMARRGMAGHAALLIRGAKNERKGALAAHGRAQDARGRASRDENCAEAPGKLCQGAAGAVLSRVASEGAEVERLHVSAAGLGALCMPTSSARGGELSI